jgi:hypothetical protein
MTHWPDVLDIVSDYVAARAEGSQYITLSKLNHRQVTSCAPATTRGRIEITPGPSRNFRHVVYAVTTYSGYALVHHSWHRTLIALRLWSIDTAWQSYRARKHLGTPASKGLGQICSRSQMECISVCGSRRIRFKTDVVQDGCGSRRMWFKTDVLPV